MTIRDKMRWINLGKKWIYRSKLYILSQGSPAETPCLYRIQQTEDLTTYHREGNAYIVGCDKLKISVLICGWESSIYIPLSDIKPTLTNN